MSDITSAVPAPDLSVGVSQFTPGAPPTPGLRRARASVLSIILLIGFLAALGPLSIDMYLPSFPEMAKDFGSTTASLSVTLAVFFFGISIGQLFYGPAADRWGRRPPLFFGLVVYCAASVGCALATSLPMLVAMRFIQAMGVCAEGVVARAIVRDCFEERDAARVFSSMMLVMGVAPIVAPIIGGWMAVHTGWRSIFWVMVAAGLSGLAVIAFLLGETHPPEARSRRGLGATLAHYGHLFRDGHFMVCALANSLALGALFVYVAGSSHLLLDVFQVSQAHFGYFFGLNAFGLIMASQVNGRLVRTIDPRRIILISLATAALAGGVLVIVSCFKLGGMVGFLVPLFLFLVSLGFSLPSTTAVAMGPHAQDAGNASAVFGFVQFVISGTAGMSVTWLSDETTRPMAIGIAIGALLALAVFWFGRKLLLPGQRFEAEAATVEH